jgi:hypothetical protein
MPPSGYKQTQSKFITSFLNSCFEALIKEADELGITFEEALKREIDNIDFAIQKDVYSESANYVMLLTKCFYMRLLNHVKSISKEIDLADVLKKIESEILEIDIEGLIANEIST